MFSKVKKNRLKLGALGRYEVMGTRMELKKIYYIKTIKLFLTLNFYLLLDFLKTGILKKPYILNLPKILCKYKRFYFNAYFQ